MAAAAASNGQGNRCAAEWAADLNFRVHMRVSGGQKQEEKQEEARLCREQNV
jgi:hypothetical protein